ncbi:MAG: ATPase [Planctomycetes bacterium]|nr:ATPase [Planctomycetota bacterium]
MKVAIPVLDGRLCLHFGQARRFALVEADPEKKEVQGVEVLDAPEHQPGVLPEWLASLGAELIIVGGMGGRAQELFAGYGIECIIGAPEEAPQKIVQDYLDGVLKTGGNVCDH